MHLMAQRHAMPHLRGKNTQLENLDPLLQVDEKRFRRRGIDDQRAAMRRGNENFRDLVGIGIHGCRHRQHHAGD